MAALRNPKHETIAQGLLAGLSMEDANEAAGYDRKARSFVANARKRVQHHGIPARLAELRADANAKDVELAELKRGWLLAQTFDELQFNIDDYLGPPDKYGNREFKLGLVPRQLLGRVEKLSIGHGQYGTTIKLEGPSKLGNRRFAAELQGYLKTQHELTGKNGGPIETQDLSENDRLRRIGFALFGAIERGSQG